MDDPIEALKRQLDLLKPSAEMRALVGSIESALADCVRLLEARTSEPQQAFDMAGFRESIVGAISNIRLPAPVVNVPQQIMPPVEKAESWTSLEVSVETTPMGKPKSYTITKRA